jgi:aldose 1-epimerase
MEIDLAAPWPYRGSVVSEVALEWNSLVQTLTVTSQDRECPAGFGWHPWFRRTLAPGSGQVSLHADAEAMWVLDSTITPTGETVKGEAVEQLWRGVQLAAGAIDGCFRMLQGNSAELTWPEVRLEMSSSANVSHLMVYTPKDGTALCVEPQTCAVNAFQLAKSGVPRTGAASARPDAPLTGWTRWTWR